MIVGRVKIDVSGIEAVVSAAKKRDISLKGAKAAAQMLKNAARSAAPKRAGVLKQAQGVKAAKGTRRNTTAAFAVQGARKKIDKVVKLPGRKKAVRVVPAFYDHLVQLGTRPHSVSKGERLGRDATRRRRSVVRTAQTGKKHPGARANPYRQRAWLAIKNAAARAVIAAMAAATQKEIARKAAKVAAAARGAK